MSSSFKIQILHNIHVSNKMKCVKQCLKNSKQSLKPKKNVIKLITKFVIIFFKILHRLFENNDTGYILLR